LELELELLELLFEDEEELELDKLDELLLLRLDELLLELFELEEDRLKLLELELVP